MIQVDYEDLDLLNIPWCIDGGYAVSQRGGVARYLHCVIIERMIGRILNWPQDHVDHINHDTLDNRRLNLRVVGSAENQHNRKGLQSNNISGIDGLCITNHRGPDRKTRQYLLAQICMFGHRYRKQFPLGDIDNAKQWLEEQRRRRKR